MRLNRAVVLVAAVGLLLPTVGCSQLVEGTAQQDATTAPLAVTEDGFGIVAGFDDAPAKIEIYTEPQCTHCADLQHDFGEQLEQHINLGTLQVTYRPLTFLDDGYDGYSSGVANAMFLASEAVDNSAATGTQFQRFVERLWSYQDPGGVPLSGEELHELAVQAGVPTLVADHIASGDEAVDVAAMEDLNFGLLFDIDSQETGTPTVYDLNAGQKLDVHDAKWLENLVQP